MYNLNSVIAFVLKHFDWLILYCSFSIWYFIYLISWLFALLIHLHIGVIIHYRWLWGWKDQCLLAIPAQPVLSILCSHQESQHWWADAFLPFSFLFWINLFVLSFSYPLLHFIHSSLSNSMKILKHKVDTCGVVCLLQTLCFTGWSDGWSFSHVLNGACCCSILHTHSKYKLCVKRICTQYWNDELVVKTQNIAAFRMGRLASRLARCITSFRSFMHVIPQVSRWCFSFNQISRLILAASVSSLAPNFAVSQFWQIFRRRKSHLAFKWICLSQTKQNAKVKALILKKKLNKSEQNGM